MLAVADFRFDHSGLVGIDGLGHFLIGRGGLNGGLQPAARFCCIAARHGAFFGSVFQQIKGFFLGCFQRIVGHSDRGCQTISGHCHAWTGEGQTEGEKAEG